MHKTMIYLNESSYQDIQKRAKLVGQSMSQLIREAVDFYLIKFNKNNLDQDDPLWQLAGLGKATDKNSDAANHDLVLYNKGKKK